MSTRPSLKVQLAELETKELTARDRRELQNTRPLIYPNKLIYGLMALGVVAMGHIGFITNSRIQEKERLLESFKPAAEPGDIVLPAENSPFYSYSKQAIEEQKPPAVTVMKEFEYKDGVYRAAAVNLANEQRPIDVEKYNQSVKSQIDLSASWYDAAPAAGFSIFCFLVAPGALLLDRRQSSKTIARIYDKYTDKDKTAPLLTPENN